MDIRRFKDELDELVGRYIVEAPTDLIADMAASLECSAAGLRVAVANTSETPDGHEDLGQDVSSADEIRIARMIAAVTRNTSARLERPDGSTAHSLPGNFRSSR